MLRATGIEVCIEGKTILGGIDAAVAAGELVGLIGPNGAGKTTLLRVMANLMPPTNGIVRCDGRRLGEYSSGEFARRVAYLAQGHTAHWPMTVEKLVGLGRLPHHRGWRGPHPDDGAIIEQVLAATDILPLRERTVGTLSGGERVRVMLARALAVEAPTLLVDEPVAALDPYHQLQVMEVLRETAHRGTAVVAVLHDLTLAARFCDRLLLLRDGRVLVEGKPADVLTGENLAQAFHVTTLRGRYEDQDYVVPWSRHLPASPTAVTGEATMPRLAPPKRLPALGIAILLHLLLAGVLVLRTPQSSPATPIVTMALVPAAPVSPTKVAEPAPALMPPLPKSMPIVVAQLPLIALPMTAPHRPIMRTAPTSPAAVVSSQPMVTPASETTLSPATTENIQSVAPSDPAPLPSNPAPEYPESARRKGIEGTVVLKVSVAADGQPISVVIATSSGHDLLDAEALRTVRTWRFQPALAHGQSVAGLVIVADRFPASFMTISGALPMSSTPLPNWDAASPVAEFLMRHFLDVDSGWSCGSFGAIAEFIRTPDEPVRFDSADALVAVTDRGGIRIDPSQGFRPIAYELTSRDPETWQQGVALCLPLDGCAMNRRSVLTELGQDLDALRPEDRTAILFDMGLNVPQADICVRTSDPRTLERLRAGIGRSLFEPGNSLAAEIPSLSPHRVFQCRFGRVEVYQAIPAPDGKSPNGPHTHVLPKLLAHDRTHAANLPIPDGWVPCMTLFPANPMRDRMGDRKPFDAARVRSLPVAMGGVRRPELVAIKAAAVAAIRAGQEFAEPKSRAGRMAAEVALRQAAWFHAWTEGL